MLEGLALGVQICPYQGVFSSIRSNQGTGLVGVDLNNVL